MFMVHILCKLEEDAVLLWLRACVCENEWSQRQCRFRGKTVRNVRNSEKGNVQLLTMLLKKFKMANKIGSQKEPQNILASVCCLQ